MAALDPITAVSRHPRCARLTIWRLTPGDIAATALDRLLAWHVATPTRADVVWALQHIETLPEPYYAREARTSAARRDAHDRARSAAIRGDSD